MGADYDLRSNLKKKRFFTEDALMLFQGLDDMDDMLFGGTNKKPKSAGTEINSAKGICDFFSEQNSIIINDFIV